jgi:hypothetical protein
MVRQYFITQPLQHGGGGSKPCRVGRRSWHQKKRLPGFMVGRPMSPFSNLKPVAPLVVLGAMLPIVERGQSMDSTLT